jgi:hypothetical protein
MNTLQKTIFALFLFALQSCSTNSKGTPKEYQANYSVSQSKYLQDERLFIDQMQKMIKTKSGSFYAAHHDSLTKIRIDTILYNKNRDKAVFLVISEDSNAKLFDPSGNPNGVHFDGRCYIAEQKTENWDVEWFKLLSIIRFPTFEEASAAIRSAYFKELGSMHGSYYNIDDVRFWDDYATNPHKYKIQKYQSENPN